MKLITEAGLLQCWHKPQVAWPFAFPFPHSSKESQILVSSKISFNSGLLIPFVTCNIFQNHFLPFLIRTWIATPNSYFWHLQTLYLLQSYFWPCLPLTDLTLIIHSVGVIWPGELDHKLLGGQVQESHFFHSQCLAQSVVHSKTLNVKYLSLLWAFEFSKTFWAWCVLNWIPQFPW